MKGRIADSKFFRKLGIRQIAAPLAEKHAELLVQVFRHKPNLTQRLSHIWDFFLAQIWLVCSNSLWMKTEEVEVEAERHRLLRVKREIYAKIAAGMRLARQKMPREERNNSTKRLNQECRLGKIRGSS